MTKLTTAALAALALFPLAAPALADADWDDPKSPAELGYPPIVKGAPGARSVRTPARAAAAKSAPHG